MPFHSSLKKKYSSIPRKAEAKWLLLTIGKQRKKGERC